MAMTYERAKTEVEEIESFIEARAATTQLRNWKAALAWLLEMAERYEEELA